MLPPLQGLSINPVAVPTDASKRSRDDDELNIVHSVCPTVKLSRCSNRARLDAVDAFFNNTDPVVMELNAVRETCVDNARYNQLKPVAVFDIVHENSGMYNDYVQARNTMSVSDDCIKYGPFLECVRTDQIEGLEDRTDIGPLRSWINEKYLVHGLYVGDVETILSSKCDPAKTSATMYGPPNTAFYQAEDVGKADQYALTFYPMAKYGGTYSGADQTMNRKLGVDVQNEVRKRTYYVLISRTLLGCANHTFRRSASGQSHAPPHVAALDQEGWKRFDLNGELIYPSRYTHNKFVEPYDSLIVEHGGTVRGDYNSGNNSNIQDQGGFREFLVTKSEQVLPVMLVAYVRVEHTPTPTFDHKRLDCFYPVKPAITTLVDQLSSIDAEDRKEAKDGLRKLVPVLFAQLRAESYVALADVHVSSSGKEVRVANAGLVKLLPSLVPLVDGSMTDAIDASWKKTALELLEEKYITAFRNTRLARAVMIQFLAREKVVAALMRSIDARQPKPFGVQLRILDKMLAKTLPARDRASDNQQEKAARRELVSTAYSDISYAMLNLGHTATLVSLLQTGFPYDPYRPKLASILNHLIEAANRRGDVVDAVRNDLKTIPALVPAIVNLPTPPGEAFHVMLNDWSEARVQVYELMGTLITSRQEQDAFVTAGGIELLVKDLLKLVEIPRRASQEEYKKGARANRFALAPTYPAIKAVFRTIGMVIASRDEHASRMLTVNELPAVLSKLIGWTKPADVAFPPLSFWNQCVAKIGEAGKSRNYNYESVQLQSALLALQVFPIARRDTLLFKNAVDNMLLLLASRNAAVIEKTKNAMSKEMEKELGKRFANASCSSRIELDSIAKSVLAYIKNDTDKMNSWSLATKQGSKDAEDLIKEKKCDAGVYNDSVVALHNEWKALMGKLDDGESAVEKISKRLLESEPSFSDRQMTLIRQLPGKLLGSTMHSKAMQEFEATRYREEFKKHNGPTNLVRLLEEWSDRPAPNDNVDDLMEILAGLTAAVTNEKELIQDLLSKAYVRETLVEHCSMNGYAASDEERLQLVDHVVGLLYVMRKELLELGSELGEERTDALQLLLLLLNGQQSQDFQTRSTHLTVRAVQDALIEANAIPLLAEKLAHDSTGADDAVKILQLMDALAVNNEWARRWMLETKVGIKAVNTKASVTGQGWNAEANRQNRILRRKHLPRLLAQLAAPSEASGFAPDGESSVLAVDKWGIKLLLNFVKIGTPMYPAEDAIHAIWVLTRSGVLRRDFLDVEVENNGADTKLVPSLAYFLAGTGTSPNDETKKLMADVFEILIALINNADGVKDDEVVEELKGATRYQAMRNVIANPAFNAQTMAFEPRFIPAVTTLVQLLA